jgi:hypothetical protein
VKSFWKKNRTRFLLTAAALLAFFFVFVMGREAADAKALVDGQAISRLGETDVPGAAKAVQQAESSRRKIITDSVEASLSREAFLRSSEQASLEESIAQSLYAEASLAQSEAESRSREASVRVSRADARKQEAAESSRQEAADESERAADNASWATAEESRRAAEEASRIAASVLAAEEASRAAAEASRRAAEQTTAYVPPVAAGDTVLIGDSRTCDFGDLGLWPRSLVFSTWNPINTAPEMAVQAAARFPAKAVFLNGIDDIHVYGNARALEITEAYISYFESIAPGTRIYVSCVLPVWNQPAGSRLSDIPGYNGMLQSMCARHGWTYVDTSAGFPGLSAFYENGDGIHFNEDWTRAWFRNVRSAVGF